MHNINDNILLTAVAGDNELLDATVVGLFELMYIYIYMPI